MQTIRTQQEAIVRRQIERRMVDANPRIEADGALQGERHGAGVCQMVDGQLLEARRRIAVGAAVADMDDMRRAADEQQRREGRRHSLQLMVASRLRGDPGR